MLGDVAEPGAQREKEQLGVPCRGLGEVDADDGRLGLAVVQFAEAALQFGAEPGLADPALSVEGQRVAPWCLEIQDQF